MKVAVFGRGQICADVVAMLAGLPGCELTCVIALSSDDSCSDDIINAASKVPVQAYQVRVDDYDMLSKHLRDADCDLAVSLLWPRILPAPVVEASRRGVLNFHGGALPRYRGNACANWAILNGETEAGVTVHLMEPGRADAGDIVCQRALPIDDATYIGDLIDKLQAAGREMIIEAVAGLKDGTITPFPQDEAKAFYCFPRLPRDGEIDWHMPAREIHKLIRASSTPYPGAYSYFIDHFSNKLQKLTIWRADIYKPEMAYAAVPGHLLKIDGMEEWLISCGDGLCIRPLEISIDEMACTMAERFKTIRQRLGVDAASLHSLMATALRELK
ncbi:MAG: methionyl-tRNA formyltransferase [Rhodospirillales bacterium]|nr:methionyl-tRNA formyltransferase [Rhodospirillales bacterium]